MERGGGRGGSATMFVVVNEERGVEGVRARVVATWIFCLRVFFLSGSLFGSCVMCTQNDSFIAR